MGGTRVSKANLRVATYGTVDELNCILGVAHSEFIAPSEKQMLEQVQQQLFCIGAEIASPSSKVSTLKVPLTSMRDIEQLEQQIDAWQNQLEPLRQFILPGGSKSAAALHHARAVCRRAERLVVELSQQEPLRNEIIVYLNRLSDWLFVFARFANKLEGQLDTPWSTNT
jgi:cob(I)alamin adenosyltransferase